MNLGFRGLGFGASGFRFFLDLVGDIPVTSGPNCTTKVEGSQLGGHRRIAGIGSISSASSRPCNKILPGRVRKMGHVDVTGFKHSAARP